MVRQETAGPGGCDCDEIWLSVPPIKPEQSKCQMDCGLKQTAGEARDRGASVILGSPVYGAWCSVPFMRGAAMAGET